MNCTEIFNYLFESFNSKNIDYVIIHSYQYLPDRFDSDIDTAINVTNIKDAIKLLDDTLSGTGWRVIQFWRHENYAADCVISNDKEFLQVDFCTHYERNGRVVMPVQELLEGKRMHKNFYVPKPQTEFTYVLVKKLLKKVFSDGSKERLTALWEAMSEKEKVEVRNGLRRFLAEDQIGKILDCIASSQYDLIDLEEAHSEHAYQSDPEGDEPSADIILDEVGLCKGQKFALHYDFGDDWMFTITVSKISEVQEDFEPRVIKSKGTIQQYPDWDEEDFDEE